MSVRTFPFYADLFDFFSARVHRVAGYQSADRGPVSHEELSLSPRQLDNLAPPSDHCLFSNFT